MSVEFVDTNTVIYSLGEDAIKGQQSLTPAEREQRRREIDAHRAKREAETQAKHSKRAAWACKIWQSATPADDSHEYLKKKGVSAHGLRVLAGAGGLGTAHLPRRRRR